MLASAPMTAFTASAQQPKVAPVGIVDHIRAGRVHTINISDSLLMLLQPAAVATPQEPDEQQPEAEERQTPAAVQGKTIGYRVQVYSDNNVRTAKNAARSKQRSVASRFPAYRTYVTFNSPYWRLKVGDFRTMQEANEAAEELKRAFPESSKEIRVVRDRINVGN